MSLTHLIHFGGLALHLDLPLRHKQNWTILFENFRGYPDGMPLRVFSALASLSQFVFDVGMNAGLYLYHGIAAAGTGAVVVGFEPNKELATVVAKNLVANGLSHARVDARCCSDRNGTAQLMVTDTDHMSSLEPGFLRARGRPILASEPVETVALDTYVCTGGLRMDLVKIDVEGHEEQVLAGAWESIQEWCPSLIVEITNINVESAIVLRLYELGYRCFYFVSNEMEEVKNQKEMMRVRREGEMNYAFIKREEHLSAVLGLMKY